MGDVCKWPCTGFSLPQVAEWTEILPQHLRNQLQPVFVTDFSRNSRMLLQGAQIELCMDQGQVSTEHLNSHLCERELELKLNLGNCLSWAWRYSTSRHSSSSLSAKPSRASEYSEQPVRALLLNLDKHDELGNVMRILIWSVLQHVQGNVHVALASSNSEYLHQLRVALRRLRVLLRMAERVCADEQQTAFRLELASLSITLGNIRNWDVFITHIIHPMYERMPDVSGLQRLLAASEQHRDAGCSALCNDAQVQALQRLLLRFGIWMYGSYWQKFSVVKLSVRDFSASYLAKLGRHFELAGKILTPSMPQNCM